MANKVSLTLLAALPLVLRSSLGTAGRYQGTVVDADTGQPIDGAAVVIVWYKETYLAFPTGDAAAHLHAVKETVTDAAGRFTLSAWRGIDWNPSTHVTTPVIIVYKPGYKALMPGSRVERGWRTFEDVERQLRHGATIHLPKLRPECELGHGVVLSPGELPIHHVPEARIPHLVQLINKQRERCGLSPFKYLPQG
jgi:hypothetical protein